MMSRKDKIIISMSAILVIASLIVFGLFVYENKIQNMKQEILMEISEKMKQDLILEIKAEIENNMSKWEGKSITELYKSEWGKPDFIEKDLFEIKENLNYWGLLGYILYTDGHIYVAKRETYEAVRFFFVNKNGIIKKWHWRGI